MVSENIVSAQVETPIVPNEKKKGRGGERVKGNRQRHTLKTAGRCVKSE